MSCGNRREEEAIVKKPRKRINGEGSIYQRKSDGRWVGQFKDPTAPGSGIRYVYASTQQEALKKLKEEMARAEAGLLGEAARTNVAEYLGWWMENVVSGEVAHRTYHNYLSQIRNHIVPRIGKKKLKALKLEEIEDLYQSMIVSGLSPATISYVHAVLRRALKQAVVRGLVPRNVAEGASLPRTGRKEIGSFTPEEVGRFLRAAKHDRLQALYVLAVTCGLRQAELLGLRWDDVDLGTGRLTVRRQGFLATSSPRAASARSSSVKETSAAF